MSKSAVYKLSYPSKWALYMSYMPWFKRGGLFVPTRDNVKMGDEVLVLVALPETPDLHALSGIVSWISVDTTQGKKPGFGIHFADTQKCKDVRNMVENQVAGWLKSEKPGYVL